MTITKHHTHNKDRSVTMTTDTDTRRAVLDALGHSIADALATLESPTDGLGKPMTPLTHTELVSSRTALSLVLVHLGALKYEITQIEMQRLHRLAGL